MQEEDKNQEGEKETSNFLSSSGWYIDYCKILVRQLVDLIEPLKILQRDNDLLKEFLKS